MSYCHCALVLGEGKDCCEAKGVLSLFCTYSIATCVLQDRFQPLVLAFCTARSTTTASVLHFRLRCIFKLSQVLQKKLGCN